ncbi:hypothetical protein V8E52_002564 [Russula decolorans]|jgi:hypothetical protein
MTISNGNYRVLYFFSSLAFALPRVLMARYDTTTSPDPVCTASGLFPPRRTVYGAVGQGFSIKHMLHFVPGGEEGQWRTICCGILHQVR